MLFYVPESYIMYLSDLSCNRKPPVQEGEETNSSGREEVSVRQRQAARLFRENFRFGSMPVQPLGSSTVFHAGVIGQYHGGGGGGWGQEEAKAKGRRRYFGSGAALIRIRKKFFRILIRIRSKVLDPTGYGSTTLPMKIVFLVSFF
jgi:hypothetical protein